MVNEPKEPTMNMSLFEMAKSSMGKAYAPYSKFFVGAALVTPNGKTFAGCNVENAAYPEGVCAEAGAISAMVLDGETKIQEIYVMGQGDALVTPCGGCRQKIREFSTPDTQIHVCDSEGIRKTLSMEELLPFSFGPENLG
ncbi:cytidine deaminase [Marinomonas sp. C2222]|uniref:Cytidine deaminase n=1 Tax=Marinomonas sargassi TaxID=2984494 RepID=A0ABT2YPW5_9GAMM|nr:cytidine deaminase [Marinomonas sargassi]MCV2401744.1 cytidine deaminase [Marinomonas sargassi]